MLLISDINSGEELEIFMARIVHSILSLNHIHIVERRQQQYPTYRRDNHRHVELPVFSFVTKVFHPKKDTNKTASIADKK